MPKPTRGATGGPPSSTNGGLLPSKLTSMPKTPAINSISMLRSMPQTTTGTDQSNSRPLAGLNELKRHRGSNSSQVVNRPLVPLASKVPS